MTVSHSHDKRTAQLKIFDIKIVNRKTAQKNLYGSVKTPSISSIYFFNHLPSLRTNSSSSTPPWVTIVYLSPLPKYWWTASHSSLSPNGGPSPLDKMVKKMVQKIVQGPNDQVHIFPYAYSLSQSVWLQKKKKKIASLTASDVKPSSCASPLFTFTNLSH